MLRLGTPLSMPMFVGRLGICTKSGAERTHQEPLGPMLRLFYAWSSFACSARQIADGGGLQR
eukprot:1704157-Alexandrium_andersonii.AAC.1